MARTQQYRETWTIPADREVWDVLRAADSYLHRQFESDGASRHVRITDERGYVEGTELSATYDDWKDEPHTLTDVGVYYREGTLSVSLYASHLDTVAKGSGFPPRLAVSADGEDAARVRGIVLEAMERAQNPHPHVANAHPHVEPATDESSSTPETATGSRLVRVMNHPWMVTVGGGLLVALIIAVVALII